MIDRVSFYCRLLMNSLASEKRNMQMRMTPDTHPREPGHKLMQHVDRHLRWSSCQSLLRHQRQIPCLALKSKIRGTANLIITNNSVQGRTVVHGGYTPRIGCREGLALCGGARPTGVAAESTSERVWIVRLQRARSRASHNCIHRTVDRNLKLAYIPRRQGSASSEYALLLTCHTCCVSRRVESSIVSPARTFGSSDPSLWQAA